jgi:hypothetical protein
MKITPFMRKGRRAFTVIEVALSATVMAFAIAGSIVVLQAGLKAVDGARNTTLASQIIQSEMERIRLLNWSEVNALPASADIDLSQIFPASSTTTAMTARFTAARACADVSGKTGEMKSITITVNWIGIDNLTHTRSTTGYYCKDGLYDYYYTLAGS